MNQPRTSTAQHRSTISNTGGVVLAVTLAAVGLMAWSWWASGPDELGEAMAASNVAAVCPVLERHGDRLDIVTLDETCARTAGALAFNLGFTSDQVADLDAGARVIHSPGWSLRVAGVPGGARLTFAPR